MNGISGVIFLGSKNVNLFEDCELIKELKNRGSFIEKYEDDNNISYSASHESKNYIFSDDKFLINLCGRIDNKEDIKNSLSLSGNVSDQELILLNFKKYGEESFNKLVGAFSFLLFNKNTKEFYVVRDHLGIKPLYFFFKNDLFIYASEPKFIFLISNEKKILNQSKLYDSILRSDENFENTFYEGIFRLERGQFIKSNKGEINKFTYHRFQTPKFLEYDNEEECFEDFRKIFFKVIDQQTSDIKKIGSALSGGLDSTSVTRVLADQNMKNGCKKEIFSYSFQFTDLDKHQFKTTDEISYVNDAISLGGLNSRIIKIPKGDYVTQLLDSQKFFPSPNLQGNRYQELYMIDSCKRDGVKILMTGFDGDVTISYGMELIQMLLRKFKVYKALKLNKETRKNQNLPGNSLRILFNYIFLWFLPSRVDFFLRRVKGLNSFGSQFRFLDKNIKREINMYDVHCRKRQNMYDIKNGHRNLLNSNHFQNAFESLDIDYSYNGIEERHPFFDKRLMEFCLNLHPRFKLKNGFSRYVLRESLKSNLPVSVKKRMTKSNLSPYFFDSAKKNLHSLIEDLLSSSSKLKDMLDQNSLKDSLSSPSKLSPEEMTWLINFSIHDQWIKQNIDS